MLNLNPMPVRQRKKFKELFFYLNKAVFSAVESQQNRSIFIFIDGKMFFL